jgi:SAM-dependent methyltransferase/uncharacterized protein YbaR (Trm112 family)
VRASVLGALRPRCVFCQATIALRSVWRVADLSGIAPAGSAAEDEILEGVLSCPSCGATWPILDGLPILIADVRTWAQQYALTLLRRDDLDPRSTHWLGDALGPGSAFDLERQYLSNYAADHWGDLLNPGSAPPQVLDILARVARPLEGPILDLGCSAGRTAFSLADRAAGPVLGMDLNPGLIRLPARALSSRRLRWSRRRVGTAYDPVDTPLPAPPPVGLDFWIGDATQPPFEDGTFGAILSFNLLDCLPNPAEHLRELARLCRSGGRIVLLTPYDWSQAATPPEAWIGGAGSVREDPASAVASMVSTHFEIEQDEREVPWSVRLHDRCRVQYQAHLIVARRL